MLTLVTVVFEPEVALLRHQARSLARYVEPGLVSRILVIDNSAAGLSERAWARLVAAYGWLGPRVRRVRPAEVIAGPIPATSGWVRQQILKLEVARLLETPWYVVLDAKNAAVAPLGEATFFEADGRAKTGRHSYRTHPLREQVAGTIAAVGADPELIDDFPVTHTPVTFRTAEVVGVVELIAGAGESTFAQEFVRRGLVEFPLYSAVLLREGSWDRWHARGVVQAPALWRKDASRDGVARLGIRIENDRAAFIAVHRAAVVRLGPQATVDLARLLIRTGVCSGWPDALRFLLGAKVAAILGKARTVRLPSDAQKREPVRAPAS